MLLRQIIQGKRVDGRWDEYKCRYSEIVWRSEHDGFREIAENAFVRSCDVYERDVDIHKGTGCQVFGNKKVGSTKK